MTPTELAETSVRALTDGFRDGTLSPVEVLAATLDHVEATNPAVNALFSIRPEEAMENARASEARWKAGSPLGILDGVPMTVKDSVAMKGWPYYHGIAANRNAPPSSFDSPPAARLKETGATIFAKTTMPDCGLLAAGVSTMFGIVRNPWGRAFNTGGSSAGAGASLAAGMGFLSVGSDIAGSVRCPAGHCGLVSLKPTQGRIPHLMPEFMRSAGPLGRSTEDIAFLMTVLSGFDERDPWSFPKDGTQYQDHLTRDVKGLRIGILTDMGFGPKPEAVVAATVEAAGKALEAEGAIVTPFVSPLDSDCYEPIDRWLMIRGYAEWKSLPPHEDHEFLHYVRDWCQPAKEMSALDAWALLGEITRMRAKLFAAFEGYDYVLAPTLPVVNFPAEEPGMFRDKPLGHTVFTAMFNQTGQPASSVNFALDERHLPIGVQVIGHRCDDLGVLQLTKTLEDLRGVTMDWPTVPRG
ncbi:amidase [Ensifer soli]|uniref:amidase n=1 Tax=Ciceribacter sp. sgz301302 TaxID=3342379 RepID=UPI0035B806DD